LTTAINRRIIGKPVTYPAFFPKGQSKESIMHLQIILEKNEDTFEYRLYLETWIDGFQLRSAEPKIFDTLDQARDRALELRARFGTEHEVGIQEY
jgi:hypothetical protein